MVLAPWTWMTRQPPETGTDPPCKRGKLNERFGNDYSFSVEMGRKNARIVQCPITPAGVVCSTRSVYCFVRIEDGAVLKSASWKTPAKGVRAWLNEILASDLAGVDQYTSWLYRNR